ncbi:MULTISPECIES: peptide-methionine (S)-S-oxide reductase MsrA [unclassified Herbaspirillum]|uniref:peptide-methionine (S)-S-oxide reductase MsrA n=1 Tax=unclassified Herbaspirillum TaxID=2624150 RepID=UPI001151683E|nr:MULTISPECIES: peptide-methionine (S)-S-oxide reductase MsrA [unclassified Herbaspirillum]MBB5390875.1 peptide-methionine (S)-S-oxide reductase [Herbaspirillum sp. SJZ102]TQK06399.1 peptide-methionine (S)-S-oxide reductase [Herbaspirillum sp. SJZ130]TQK12123.1 peptide-methionine (S)-S-oxide reductase [Herbaspirillum sp. SJZ106]
MSILKPVAIVSAAAALCLALASMARVNAAEPAVAVPAAVGKAQLSSTAQSETIVLAGGCFWGVQGVFQHTQGVLRALSGYAGGKREAATYEMVSSGGTGHAEAVQVTYDPRKISFGQILQIYFSVAHDPTQLNRQGPDHGTQYRSAIFTASQQQQQAAEAYIAQINAARVFSSPIVTQVTALQGFYPAEDYHQDYATLHPNQPYIAYNDLPKIANLQKMYPAIYRADPVLVMKR